MRQPVPKSFRVEALIEEEKVLRKRFQSETVNNDDSIRLATEEANRIVFQEYPDSSIKTILEAYAHKEEWFKSLLEGTYNVKERYKTQEAYDQAVTTLIRKIRKVSVQRLELQ